VSNVPVGEHVRILFDGDQVGSGDAEADAVANARSSVVRFGGASVPAGVATATVVIDFVVPSRPQGTYIVTAVGATFTAPCGPGIGGEFGVLATTTGGDDGSLPKTGIYVGVLVAVALALLVAGRALLVASRRRRRRARRSSARTRAGV
jgi:LPXTG-motif cell wall-anchored protein